MRERLRELPVILVALAVTFVTLRYTGPHTPSMLQSTREISGSPSWNEYLEPSVNAFFTWRALPWDLAFEPLFPSLILLLGVLCLIRLSLLSAMGASAIALCCGIAWGEQPIVLTAVCWIPILIWCRLTAQNSFYIRALMHLCVGIGIAGSAYQLGIISIVLGLWGSVILSDSRSTVSSARTRLTELGILLFPSLVMLALAPLPYFAAYPQGTQVVPDDEIPGMLRPFIGPLPPVPIIDRWALRDIYGSFSLFLACISAAFFFVLRGSVTLRQRVALLVLGVLPLCDTVLPEAISILSPLQVIPRIIPGIFFFPLVGIAAAGASIILLTLILRKERLLLTFGAAAIVFIGTEVLLRERERDPAVPSTLISLPRFSERWISPSHFVLRHYGPWILERETAIRAASFRALSEAEVELTSSHNPQQLKRIFSARPQARWSARGGSQRGSEWIIAKFTAPLSLEGIELDLGAYFTDFPRGIRVSSLNDCSDITSKDRALPRGATQILDIKDWRGAVEFTEDGFPFFRGRYDVKLYFPSSITTSCLLLEQTAQAEGCDWSIHKIKVYESPRQVSE